MYIPVLERRCPAEGYFIRLQLGRRDACIARSKQFWTTRLRYTYGLLRRNTWGRFGAGATFSAGQMDLREILLPYSPSVQAREPFLCVGPPNSTESGILATSRRQNNNNNNPRQPHPRRCPFRFAPEVPFCHPYYQAYLPASKGQKWMAYRPSVIHAGWTHDGDVAPRTVDGA